jgi:hypothetical protein
MRRIHRVGEVPIHVAGGSTPHSAEAIRGERIARDHPAFDNSVDWQLELRSCTIVQKPVLLHKPIYCQQAMPRRDSVRRFLLVLFVLCATLTTQSASYVDEHETHHAGQHCCHLCHGGPAPIVSAAVVSVAAPVHVRLWLRPCEGVRAQGCILVSSTGSRAPPA